MAKVASGQQVPAIDRALRRVLAEIHDGLRHGFFEFTLTCEVVGHEGRRLTLRAGKSHQFVIPKDECLRTDDPIRDSRDGSVLTTDQTRRISGTESSRSARFVGHHESGLCPPNVGVW
jgi:hypothetical protein